MVSLTRNDREPACKLIRRNLGASERIHRRHLRPRRNLGILLWRERSPTRLLFPLVQPCEDWTRSEELRGVQLLDLSESSWSNSNEVRSLGSPEGRNGTDLQRNFPIAHSTGTPTADNGGANGPVGRPGALTKDYLSTW